MAKGGAPTEIMPAAELKPLLVLSKRQAVGCAIGLTRDKQGLVLLHRRKKPRKLMAELLRQAKGAGTDVDRATLRFGRATVDGASDSSTVHFTVNKHAPDALRIKLLERLRPVGFQHCDVTVDEGLESESDEGEDGDDEAEAHPHGGPAATEPGIPAPDRTAEAAAPAAPARQVGTPPDDRTSATMRPATEGPVGQGASGAPAADAGAADPAGSDPGMVRSRLASLARRATAALAADPSGTDAIRAVAGQARQALASGDAATAGQAADTLERLLPPDPASRGLSDGATGTPKADAGQPSAQIGTPPDAARHPTGSPVFAKGQAAWTAVRTKLQADIDTAMKGMAAAYGDGDPRVRAILDRVEPIMRQLDDSLAIKLGEVAANGAPEAHAPLVKQAEAIIGRYRAFVDGEPMIAGLDSNPFHPMAVRRTIDTALAALSKVVGTAA